MAKLKGKLQIEGTLDGLSFYKTQDGIIVRQKWGPDKKRMKNDPAFEGARNHGKEFGAAARHSSFLRSALRNFLKDTADNRVTGRVNKLLFDLTKLDTVSKRGERQLHIGIEDKKAKALIESFEFNINCLLKRHLLKMPVIKKKKSLFVIEDTLNKQDLYYPVGATHAELKAGWLCIDFENKSYQLEESNSVIIERKTNKTVVQLKTTNAMSGKGCNLFILKLVFLKKQQGVMQTMGNEFKAGALYLF